jgi:hypothetical protein
MAHIPIRYFTLSPLLYLTLIVSAMLPNPKHDLRDRLPSREQAARTSYFAVRVFTIALIVTVPYSIAVSKLRLQGNACAARG